jgi:hypothetical protein
MRNVLFWLSIALLASSCLYGQSQSTEGKSGQNNEAKGLPPRAAPTDYQAHAQAGAVTVVADFMGHAVPVPEGPLSTEDYVVIEAGLFGPPDARIKLSIDDFSLRINGKKTPLSSQPYGLVTKSLKDPEWTPPGAAEPKSKSSFGTGGQSDSNLPPAPVHVPIELQRAMARHVQKAALPEGDRALPQAGLIFFPYRGKTQTIRSIELNYTGPAGQATLTLQP